MFRLQSVLLLLVTYSGNFGQPLLATKISALDDCASFPVAPLMITDCVRITLYNRRTFPFTLNDPRMLLQPHSEPLQDDAASVLKFAANNLEQPMKKKLPQRETEHFQEPENNILLKADINALLVPTKEELQQPINKVLYQARGRGLVTPTSEDVHEQVLEDLQQGEVWALLERTVWACHQLLQYFDAHLTQMNLDAVLGTRIAEAQFRLVWKALQEEEAEDHSEENIDVEEMRACAEGTHECVEGTHECKGTKACVEGTRACVERLWTLGQEAAQVSSMGELFIMKANPDYYHELGALLRPGFWEVPLTTRAINITTSLMHPHDLPAVLEGEEQLVEKQSDECLAELLGGSMYLGGSVEDRNGGGGDVLCTISQKCWQRMTAQGYSGYSLTHQVFYLIIGLRAGCGEQLELLAARDGGVQGGARSDVAHILVELCTAVLEEATTISQAGFPDYRRDLFMEQGALCGILGYTNFFRKDWLTRVLSWQQDSGCFGASSVFPDQLTTPHHTRMRREERPMAGHCLAHRSAVALGYLSLSVRFLVTVL